MKKTKILRIIARLNIGGPAIHTILLSDELKKLGYETVLVKGSEGKSEGNMMDLAESRGINPVVIPELGREIGLINDIKAFLRLYKLIKKEKPDIVHTHTAKAGTLGRIAAWLAGVPVIVHTFHGHVLTGYFGRLKSWCFIQIEKALARLSSRLITLSDKLKEELIGMGIGNQGRFEIIPLGLDLKPFLDSVEHKGEFRNEFGLSGDAVIVGIIGRLVPIKGHRLFLEAAKSVISDFGFRTSDLKFIIVGDGELRRELESYAEELGIADSVVFTGFRRDLPVIYSDLDIIALTSLNEGTPVSIIEAMASGKPVVAADVGGVSSLVKDSVTGFLVRPGDVRSLAEALLWMVREPEKRQKMGAEGRRRIYPAHDISQLIERIAFLYSGLLKNKD